MTDLAYRIWADDDVGAINEPTHKWRSHARVDIILYDASHRSYVIVQQELSYRQQIARQLRTQYAEGIYRHKYYVVTSWPWNLG